MARAIIRWSVNKGSDSNPSVRIGGYLLDQQWKRVGTQSFESRDAPVPELLLDLERVLHHFRTNPNTFQLDHFWIYLDRNQYTEELQSLEDGAESDSNPSGSIEAVTLPEKKRGRPARK